MAKLNKKRRAPVRKKATTNALQYVTSALIVLFAIALMLSIGMIGYSIYYFNDARVPTTQTTGEVDSLTYAPDEKYAFEVNLFTNENDNGLRAYEWRANYYIDTSIPSSEAEINEVISSNTSDGLIDASGVIADCFKTIYSSGVQMLGNEFFEQQTDDIQVFLHTEHHRQYIPNTDTSYYYNSTQTNVSYSATDCLDYLDKWIIDFGKNSLGRITQDKPDIQVWWSTFYSEWAKFNINSLMYDFYNTILSLDYGKQVVMFKLSNYLTFEYFDTADCKFHTPESDDKDLYVNILVNKSANGMADKSQSLFNIVQNNANWSFDGVQNINYWKSTAQITLNELDFDLKDGLLSLKKDTIEYYCSFNPEKLDILVVINLDNVDASGLAKNAFEKLPIKKITISSLNNSKTFQIAEKPVSCEIATIGQVSLIYGGGN